MKFQVATIVLRPLNSLHAKVVVTPTELQSLIQDCGAVRTPEGVPAEILGANVIGGEGSEHFSWGKAQVRAERGGWKWQTWTLAIGAYGEDRVLTFTR